MIDAVVPPSRSHRQPGLSALGMHAPRAARLADRARRWLHGTALLCLLTPLAASAQGLWLDEQGQPRPAAREVVQWLTQAASDGLQPADYDAERWAQALDTHQPLPAERAAQWDELLTQTVTRYLQDLRHGKLGVMDYYNLQNLLSDTRMRETLSKLGPNPEEEGPVSPK